MALCALLVFSDPLFSEELKAEGAHVSQGLAALEAQDLEGAADAFQQAFDAGDPDGAFYLGRMLELGIGGPANQRAAVGLYRAASDLGSGAAKNRLGVLHIRGNGVLQDYAEGARLVCEGAELDDVNGAFNCGTVMLEGLGTDKDEAQAYVWLAKAADQGHVAGMTAYAAGLIEGKYVAQDIPAAVALLERSASRGDPHGFYALAQIHQTGLDGPPDLIEAHKNFNLAAALGHPEAAEARARVEAGMSAADITTAQEQAKAWRPLSGAPQNAMEG